jgi:hypothetical protein
MVKGLKYLTMPKSIVSLSVGVDNGTRNVNIGSSKSLKAIDYIF